MIRGLFIVICVVLESLVIISVSVPHVKADILVDVDRVRWKKGTFSWRDHSAYPEWKAADIWTEYRKRTYIGRYWQPSVPATQNLILLIAGQQGFSGSSGGSNCITGQGPDWDQGFGSGDQTLTRTIKPLSLAGRLIQSGQFRPHDTFLAIVFDANFNYEHTSGAKQKAEQAFTQWLLKHGDPSSVERIILLGSSRGGALATRIARHILTKPAWSNSNVLVGLVDAVANTSQDELLSQDGGRCVNPLNTDYFSRQAQLDQYFNTPTQPRIRHITTGAPVILGTVHSFCATQSPWYEQSFANLEHKEIGRCVYSEGQAYQEHLMNQGIVPVFNWLMEQL